MKIRTQQLVSVGQLLSDPWLMTLNCCSSGQATKQLQSMAHQVVSAGFPAAVAMLEPVATKDAHEFTRSFYASLFGGLRRAADTLVRNPSVEFEWVEPMYAARAAVCDLHQGAAADSREWALPVLYLPGHASVHVHTASDPSTNGRERREAESSAGGAVAPQRPR